MRKIFLCFLLLFIFINLFLVNATKITERAPPEQICCGRIGFDKEKIIPNKTISQECCSYTINPELCSQCVIELKQSIKEQEFRRNLISYGSSALVILLLIISAGFFVLKRKTLDWKDFYKLKIIKVILFLVISAFAGLITLIQAMTYDATSPLALVVVYFFFWPFLLVVWIEKLIFVRVDWLHFRDIPFVFVAFIVTILFIYSLVCIIYYLFKRKNK